MSGQSTAAGWYADPQDPSRQRYWDGAAWTEAVQPMYGGAPPGGYGAPVYGQQVGYGYAQGPGRAEFAGFWSRFAAVVLDGLVVGIPLQVLETIALSISDAAAVIVNIAGFIGGIFYYAYLEGGTSGQTLGKRALSIRVVDANTYQPGVGIGRGVGRYFAKLLSGLPCGLGYFWMLWDGEKQTWHDKLASTKVVKV